MKTKTDATRNQGVLPREKDLPAALQSYLKGIGETPLLNRTEETRLARRVRRGETTPGS